MRRAIVMAAIGLALCMSVMRAASSDDAFNLGFHNPQDITELSWWPQPGATEYQLLSSTVRDCSTDCVTFETSELYQTDPTQPGAGGGLYYLVRVLQPDPGSWGTGPDGSQRTVSCMAPRGRLVDGYGCKDWGGNGGATGTERAPDCIEYEYLGGGHLVLTHVNTAFNCCPEFEAGIDVVGDAIVVWENEISGDCDCLCLFDLYYEIDGIAPGIYDVTVIQEYLDETDEPLEFTMDLLSSPSGSHCVDRDHYPW